MESPQTEFLLKVLSGPHQGAEVVLHQGDTIIGNNLESDVILSDAMIAENHLKLTISGSEVSITLSEGKNAYVEGIPVSEETQTIQIFQVITLGTTHLVIGPLNETWPQINIPKLQEEAEEDESTDEKEDEDTDDIEDNSTNSGEDKDNEKGATEGAADKEGKESQPSENQKDTKKKESEDELIADQLKEIVEKKLYNKKWVFGILTGAGVFLLLLLILVWPSAAAPIQEQIVDPAQAQVMIEDRLKELGLAASIAVDDKEDRVIIKGYVDTNAQKRAAQSAIRQVNSTFKTSIWSQENLVTGAQEVMSIFKIPVRITSGSTLGRVKATGYAPDTQAWEKAKHNLTTDVPGLVGLDDEVLTPQIIHKLTHPILSKYELTSKVFIIPEKTGVTAKGFLSDSISQVWAQAKPSIEQALGPNIPFRDKVQLTSSAILERIYFDSQIGSITLDGNMSWITLQDGQTFFVGSSLPSGFTVESITRQGVVLKRGKERVTLKTGDR